MQRLVIGATALALFVFASAASSGQAKRLLLNSPLSAGASSANAPGLAAVCPKGTLPDNNACVPVPVNLDSGGLALPEAHNAHRDRHGQWQEYDHIPKLPERPADYRAYHLPITPPETQSFVTSGYDLDLADDDQRRGAELHAVGHGGVDIAQKRGTEVHFVNLEHQEGDAEVLYTGPLFGNTVVTVQTVREGGLLRQYLILFGHLERAAGNLSRGSVLHEGDIVGYVGDSGSPGDFHLHFEARRLREGVSPEGLETGDFTRNSKSVACDPRNVLPFAD